MEPITEWMEEELQRNDMMPRQVHVGAAKVTFEDPTWATTEMVPTAAEAELIAKIGNVIESVEQLPKDMVTLPDHYARFTIEPIRFVIENKLNFFQANIVKYIMRYDAKNGLEDLKKAQRYLTMFIKWVEGDPDWWR
jgi:hypothetical protein